MDKKHRLCSWCDEHAVVKMYDIGQAFRQVNIDYACENHARMYSDGYEYTVRLLPTNN